MTHYARRLCVGAGIGNLTLHAVDFAAASDIDLIYFDYIVAHGVHSWVAPLIREDMCRFIDRRLKQGGLVYISYSSYNAMPGGAADAPFQYLLRENADTCSGDSKEKFLKALSLVQAYTASGAPGIARSPLGLPARRLFAKRGLARELRKSIKAVRYVDLLSRLARDS